MSLFKEDFNRLVQNIENIMGDIYDMIEDGDCTKEEKKVLALLRDELHGALNSSIKLGIRSESL